jgi:hypothetical protein
MLVLTTHVSVCIQQTYDATNMGIVNNRLRKYDYAFLIGVVDLYFYRL